MFKSIEYWYGVIIGIATVMIVASLINGNFLGALGFAVCIAALVVAYFQDNKTKSSKAYALGKGLLAALAVSDRVQVVETNSGISIAAEVCVKELSKQDSSNKPEPPSPEEPEPTAYPEPQNPLDNLKPAEQDPEPPAQGDPETPAE